ncbi:MAG: TlpA family protein disulfide reductase [Chitinophagaceae bacterium]|nr:MAG: TlpA family protein disulfide reductase [Chitinophagaceae bacterium]
MTRFLPLLLPLSLLILFSCNPSSSVKPGKQAPSLTKETQKADSPLEKNFPVDRDAILKDFMTWYNYTYYTIHLAQDFIGLDDNSTPLDKTGFLSRLQTGNYVPFKIKERETISVYQLYKLQRADQDIQSQIKQLAATEMKHYQMEGSELPDYAFTDINGRQYNKANTKGNVLLLKCWFINCVACVKEFPELNNLVDNYRDRKDLLFVSLAMDTKEKLVSFLSKKPFRYAVVPGAEAYMSEKLNVSAYPMHILVDRNGRIVKVTNTVEDIIPFVERQFGKTAL